MPLRPLGTAGPAPVFTGRDVSWTLIGIIISGILALVAIWIIGFIVQYLSPGSGFAGYLSQANTNYAVAGASILVQNAIFVGGVYLFAIRRNALGWSVLAARPLSAAWVWWAVGFAIAFIVGGTALELVSAQLYDGYKAQTFGMTDRTLEELMILLPVVGIIAPIGEEVLFRGLLFNWLRRRWNFWVSAIFSSALFGFVHLDPVIIIFAGTVGVGLAWLYEKSHNLLVPIIAHVVTNSAAVLWVFFSLDRFIK